MAQRGEREQVLMMLPAELGRRLEALEQAERDLHDIVRDLVLAGYSWADVGRMLGVTRQSARERFNRDVLAWRQEHGDALPWEVYAPTDMDALDAAGQW